MALTTVRSTGISSLPSISGANLTSLPAGNLTGTLPAISGANLTGISAGITMADNWRITTDVTGTNSPLTSNWEQVDTNGMGTIGSAMTQSSGIFTFPTTGIYQVSFTGYLESTANQRYHSIQIYATTDNSSYYHMTESSKYMNYTGNNAYSGVHCSCYFDVTNTSNCKIQFRYIPATSDTKLLGASSYSATHVMFIRMGDT